MDTNSLSDIQTMYENMCRELNMDKQTEENGWASFLNASQTFTLEGEPRLWLCCAVVVACTESFMPTVGGSNEMVKNGVSLTKILRVFNVSLYQFFEKAKKWCELGRVSRNFLNTLDRLEQSCKITLNLKDSYRNIYMKIFIVPPHVQESKKSRSSKCSVQKLYEFTWCLFLCAKNQGIPCTVDLVSSLHLLLCCIDLIYRNALEENRVDLINPAYEGLPKNWNTPDFDGSTLHKHCIIDQLCKTDGGLEEQAKLLKADSFKKIISEFIETKTLLGDKQTLKGFISNSNFESNLKSLNNAYERYILSVGDFDERILPPNLNSPITKSDGSGASSSFSQSALSLGPCTPLLRRNHLPAKDNISEPVASATQNVKILHEIAAQQEYIDFIKQTGDGTYEKLEAKHEAKEAIFVEKFPGPMSEAKARYQLARHLYYYLLTKIVLAERRHPKIALETDTINIALVVCCLQIVLFSYESDLKFPWILKCFNLKAFNFVKIIELVVKYQDNKLSREMIKHLNFIEERCLEYLVWTRESPIWEHVQKLLKRNEPLPTWQEVKVKNRPQNSTNSSYEGFNSTSTASTSDSARRNLFNAGKANETKRNNAANASQQAAVDKPLKIVLRKIYELCWMRLKELCTELNMGSEEHTNIIWTLFEYSITQRTELMKDRHLDQLIMCAIYIYIKVGEIPGKTFTDIMKLYRKQPQATSQIYREILIDPSKPDGERTGDIINFYNNIYVQKMTPYALGFGDKNKSQHDLLLSPHPNDRVNPTKRVSNCLTVRHLEKSDICYSPNSFVYKCYQSPAKDLSNINEIISGNFYGDQSLSLGKRKGENTTESSEIIHPSKRNLNFNRKDSSVIATSESNHFNSQLLSIKKDRQAGQKE